MAETSQPVEGFTQATDAGSPAAVKNTTPVYEVGFHIIPTVGEDGVPAVLEKIRTLLGDAEIISQTFPTKRALAYRVERAQAGAREKYLESYFGFIKFATEREMIPAIEQGLRSIHEVLRYLLIQTVREDITQAPRRAVFSSDRLEGKTIEKPVMAPEKAAEVSDAELDKSIEALTG
ncbi:hypothetical protein EXS62_00735 [Candidatus Kaiserbacteria bacterium]|nr:hypothetical protein [Candidatus Kaiserbacteria bacterium]